MNGLYLDIGGTNFRWCFLNNGQTLVGFDKTDSAFLQKIEDLVVKFSPSRIGASFAGQVHEGVILSAPNISTFRVEFESHFKSKFGIECKIDNDLKCAILAESSVRPDIKNMILLYIGTGFGSAILENGKVVRGYHNMAGEIGHIPFKSSSRICGCGKSNCVELYCSGSALQSRMGLLGKDYMLESILEYQDQDSKDILDDFKNAFKHAITTIVTLFNPELVILGGGIVLNNIQFFDKMIAECSNLFFTNGSSPLNIEISGFSDGSLEGAKLLFA